MKQEQATQAEDQFYLTITSEHSLSLTPYEKEGKARILICVPTRHADLTPDEAEFFAARLKLAAREARSLTKKEQH